jgi:prepilin peptidase CpaA
VNVTSWLLIGVVSVFTLTAAICDYRSKKIPNRLTVPGFLAALVFHAVVGAVEAGWSGMGLGLLNSLAGFGVGFGILLVLWLIGGGGAGDVKLMGAVGAWLGPKPTLIVFLVSTVFVMVLSVASLTWRMIADGMWKTKRRYLSSADETAKPKGLSADEAMLRHKVRRRLLPYGVPVALATWVVLAWTFRDQLFAH